MIDFSLIVDQALYAKTSQPAPDVDIDLHDLDLEDLDKDTLSFSGSGNPLHPAPPGGLSRKRGRCVSRLPGTEIDDATREKIAEKMVEKAMNCTGDGPISPLARTQIENVSDLVKRKLAMASTSSMAIAVKMVVECENALKALIPELSTLCAYPKDEQGSWQDPMVRACREVAVVLPKLQYARKHSRGPCRQIVMSDLESQIASTEIAFYQEGAKRDGHPPRRPPPERLGQERLSRTAGLRQSESIGSLPLVRQGMEKVGWAQSFVDFQKRLGVDIKHAVSQTDWESDVDGDIPEVRLLKARIHDMEHDMRGLLHERTAAQTEMEAAQSSLRAKSKAVVEIRTGLYREVCILKEQLALAGGHSSSPGSGDHRYDPGLSALEGLERESGSHDEVARLKEQHSRDKAALCKELAHVQQRFRAMLRDRVRANEDEAPKGTVTAEHCFAIQEMVEGVKGEYHTFAWQVEQLLADYREALADLHDRHTSLASMIENLNREAQRGRLLQKVFEGLVELFTPLFTLRGGERMEEGMHPWEPYGNLEDPLAEYMCGEEGLEVVEREMRGVADLHTLATTLVFSADFSGSSGAPEQGVQSKGVKKAEYGPAVSRLIGLTGGRLIREAERILTKSDVIVSGVERDHIRIVLERDEMISSQHARILYTLALNKINIRKALRALKHYESAKGPPAIIARERMKIRRVDARIVDLNRQRKALKIERVAGPTEEDFRAKLSPLIHAPSMDSEASPSVGSPTLSSTAHRASRIEAMFGHRKSLFDTTPRAGPASPSQSVASTLLSP